MRLNGMSIGWTVIAAVLTVIAGYVASRLSSDALGMAVGIVFGALACVPISLLVLAGERRQVRRDGYYDDDADDDTPHTVNNFFVVTNNNDNRQLTINTTPAQGMPLLADREREIQAQRMDWR